ncbi:MAG: transglycosylase domain-containing protein [Actinomycetota bacterium]
MSHPFRSRIALLALMAVVASSCAPLAARLDNLPELKKRDLNTTLAQSTKIFAKDGRLITTLHGPENRQLIRSLKKIPPYVLDAVVAIEDERFYEHDGVDLRAIMRAAVSNAASGEIREGGSTITQQYVKNVIIAPGETAAKTLDRKIEEAALSRQLEKFLGKDEILRRYLNTVYFGNGAYGIQAAAKTYFGKPARKLSIHEGAMLAGLIRSPETYDPYDNPDPAKRRRDLVLDKMAELGHIGEDQAEAAAAKKVRLESVDPKDRYPAPYFVDYVQRLLTYDPRFKMLGKTVAQRTQSIFQGGLRIHTTVDLDMQDAAEEAVKAVLPNGSDPYASLVAVEPDTGRVRAMVGGRDWFARPKKDPYGKLNLAILAEPGLGPKQTGRTAAGTGRQAGSAFKPFALAAAIQDGVSLSQRYDASSSKVFPNADAGNDWTVQNYEGGSFGKSLSLLEATVSSVNVVYAQLILDIGEEPVVELATEMGINTPLSAVPSAVLGVNPVNPLGMASAFSAFATNGERTPPVAIEKITTATGKVVYQDKTESEQVLEPAVASIVTGALEQVVQRGTGTGAQIGRPMAGKTGTAQEWRDAWFAGYTPALSAAVWVGYPAGEIEMKTSCANPDPGVCRPTRLTVTGGSWPAEIWSRFMSRALANIAADDFPPTPGLVTRTIDVRTGCLAGKLTPEEFRTTAQFVKGTEPKKQCRPPKNRLEVPDVVGFPVDQAVKILNNSGFKVDRVEEPTRQYPPGFVVSQAPGGGKKAREGATVTLTVSVRGGGGSGGEDDDTVTMPDVLGLKREEAKRILRDEGLVVNIIYQRESNEGQARRNRDRVWKQRPPAGTEVERGSEVTIWVNP